MLIGAKRGHILLWFHEAEQPHETMASWRIPRLDPLHDPRGLQMRCIKLVDDSGDFSSRCFEPGLFPPTVNLQRTIPLLLG